MITCIVIKPGNDVQVEEVIVFSEKLELLMRLTATRNNMLSRALHMDEAAVSRLRSGKRRLPRDPVYLKPLCVYFAGQLKEDYQRRIVAEAISPGEPWPIEEDQAIERLYEWLSNDLPHLETPPADRTNASPSGQKVRKSRPVCTVAAEQHVYYYGLEGKRAALAAFFETVMAAGKPVTIMMFSDESSAWLTGDAQFSRLWEKYILDAIGRGNRFRVIHTISRPLDELVQVISLWMPLYATGKLEPFIHPRLREGISRRTLFVAPSIAALSATSVGAAVESSLTQLVIEPEAVKALAQEFENYLQLCIPLARSYQGSGGNDLQKRWLAMNDARGASVSAHKAPSLATMPASVAHSIAREYNNAQLPDLVDRSLISFQDNIKQYNVAEIIILPSMDMPDRLKDRIALPGFPGMPPSFYTREEFASHLEQVVRLMRRYDNYYVAVGQTPSLLEQLAIHYKERYGVLITLNNDPDFAFFFDESALTEAFGEYLSRWIPYQAAFPRESRDTTAAILLKAADELRQSVLAGVRD